MTGTYTHPSEYDVMPKQWKVIDHPKLGEVVAAMLPYPVLHPEDAACTGDPAWVDDTISMGNGVHDSLQGAYMRATCHKCPLLVACREYGIAHEGSLMFGGLTPSERARVRKERRQLLVEPHAAYVYGLSDSPHVYVLNLNGEAPDAEG